VQARAEYELAAGIPIHPSALMPCAMKALVHPQERGSIEGGVAWNAP